MLNLTPGLGDRITGIWWPEHGDLVIGATRIWLSDWTFLCPDRGRFNLMSGNEK